MNTVTQSQKTMYPKTEDVEVASTYFRQISARGKAITETLIEIGLDLVGICELVPKNETDTCPRFALLGYTTFKSFLADPEIDMKERRAFTLKGIAETYVLRYEIPSETLSRAGVWKLDRLRSYIDRRPNLSPSEVEEMVVAVSVLSRSDVIDYMRDLDSGQDSGEYDAGREEVRSVAWKTLPIDWSSPRVEIYKSAVSHLLNEILELRPEWVNSPMARTAVKILRLEGD